MGYWKYIVNCILIDMDKTLCEWKLDEACSIYISYSYFSSSDIIKKYQLYTDDQDRKSNMVDENETLDKTMPTLEGGKVMDSKLSKIWKKAQEVGFSGNQFYICIKFLLHVCCVLLW